MTVESGLANAFEPFGSQREVSSSLFKKLSCVFHAKQVRRVFSLVCSSPNTKQQEVKTNLSYYSKQNYAYTLNHSKAYSRGPLLSFC